MTGKPWKKKKELEERIYKIIMFFRTKSPITTRNITTILGEKSWHTTMRYLEKLENKNLIKRIHSPNKQILWIIE